jgi:hypothetical protein
VGRTIAAPHTAAAGERGHELYSTFATWLALPILIVAAFRFISSAVAHEGLSSSKNQQKFLDKSNLIYKSINYSLKKIHNAFNFKFCFFF